MNDPYELVIPEKRVQLRLLANTLAKTVREYFQDEEHRRQFEEWYLQRYGKPYTWQTVKKP